MAHTLDETPQSPPAPAAQERAGPLKSSAGRFVRQFHQIVLLPLQLMPREDKAHIDARYWDLLAGEGSVWTEIDNAFPADPRNLPEGQYREFETFLPHVQRFLYGRSPLDVPGGAQSPVRVFRRRDIAQVRITLADGADPLLFEAVHVDLHLFPDVNVALLAVEIAARDLPLEAAQEVMYRFGRAYPAGWSQNGEPSYCLKRVEWLGRAGRVLAASDYEAREKFSQSVCRRQAAAIAAHWAYAVAPLVAEDGPEEGPLRYRLVGSNRMPVMAYLALEDSHSLTANDYVRLGLALAPGDPNAAPYGPVFLKDFDNRYCYDRFHDPTRADSWIDTRMMCCGYAFVTVGDARLPLFTDPERGVLALFRRQLFVLGLMAHFHRATLLMLLDRFVRTINGLDVERAATVRRFRSELRQTIETFLTFSHRYWFFEITDQPVPRDIYRMWSGHLDTGRLYTEVNDELQRMNQYLDSVMLRRTSGTIVRLTVVAILSLIGTATTGFLGMNLLDATEAPVTMKAFYFAVVAALAVGLTVYTIVKSHRLSEFLDTLADERRTWRQKLGAFLSVWGRR